MKDDYCAIVTVLSLSFVLSGLLILLLLDTIGMIHSELYFCHSHIQRQALVLIVFSLRVLVIVV